MSDFLQLAGMLLLFLMVLGGAYYTTKWLSRLQYQQSKGKNMQLIETLRISPNQVVQLIKVGERYFAIAVSKEQIQLLSEFNKDEIKEILVPPMKGTGLSFKEQLHQLLNRGKKEND